MRVLITGGAGHVGKPICQKFARNGWDVRVVDLARDPDIDGVRFAHGDIRDFASLAPLVEGCDAIVHLAAIPSTMTHPDAALFAINVAGTYNVFEAAERAGVKRIAQASSINAFGGYWGCDDRQYDYFPLDEAHPLHTTDVYSFSKQLVEEIAAYYQRRSGIDSISFRLPAVWSDANIAEQNLRDSLKRKAAVVARLFGKANWRSSGNGWRKRAPKRSTCAHVAFRNTMPSRRTTSIATPWKTGSCALISSIASTIGHSFTRTTRPRHSRKRSQPTTGARTRSSSTAI